MANSNWWRVKKRFFHISRLRRKRIIIRFIFFPQETTLILSEKTYRVFLCKGRLQISLINRKVPQEDANIYINEYGYFCSMNWNQAWSRYFEICLHNSKPAASCDRHIKKPFGLPYVTCFITRRNLLLKKKSVKCKYWERIFTSGLSIWPLLIEFKSLCQICCHSPKSVQFRQCRKV